jgi:hypothetical protein
MAETAHKRYAEIMRDVETMINDHSELQFAISFEIRLFLTVVAT